jgi:hypothetical protein
MITNLLNLGKHKRLYVSKEKSSGYVFSSSSFSGSIFSPPSTWMLRRNCIQKVGYFDEAMLVLEDADYFVRVLDKFRIYFLNQTLSIKHILLLPKRTVSYRQFQGKEYFLKKHFAKMKKDKRYLSRFYYGVGKDFLNSDKPDKARIYFLKAFAAYPAKLGYLLKYFKCYRRYS